MENDVIYECKSPHLRRTGSLWPGDWTLHLLWTWNQILTNVNCYPSVTWHILSRKRWMTHCHDLLVVWSQRSSCGIDFTTLYPPAKLQTQLAIMTFYKNSTKWLTVSLQNSLTEDSKWVRRRGALLSSIIYTVNDLIRTTMFWTAGLISLTWQATRAFKGGVPFLRCPMGLYWCATFPLWHFRDPLQAHYLLGLQCPLCFSNYTTSESDSSIFHFFAAFFNLHSDSSVCLTASVFFADLHQIIVSL